MNPVEQIKERISILDVVSTYVRVEKSGNQYKARCPFHNEKTPSFYVSPSRNSFHCFGCGVSGDIFSFIENIEHIPFREALVLLAERAGVSLDNRGNKNNGSLLEILAETTQFFKTSLQKHPSVLAYALGRGMTESTLDEFNVGYSEVAWRTVYEHLKKSGFADEDIEKSGVVIKSEKGYYDRFRGRLMFPIQSPSGKVVGFTGRVLPEIEKASDKPLAKYVNTPETELYHKSKILFGYDKAKSKIADEDLCIVVEGQMDVILSHQCGMTNTVGVSGTAFTEEQLTLILRMTKNIALSFDSDKAGQSAMLRSAELGLLADANIEIIHLGTQKDPADIIVQDPNIWYKKIQERVHVIDYLLKTIRTELSDDRNFALEVKRVVLPLTSRIKSHIDREYFLKKIAASLQVSIESVHEDLKQYISVHPISEEIETPKTTNKNTSRLVSTYEELIGLIELHSDILSDEVRILLQEIYTHNAAEIIPYDEFPESEKIRLQIRADILNPDPDSRRKNVPIILMELRERLLDTQIEKLHTDISLHESEQLLATYHELIKKRNIIRDNKNTKQK
ncbi:MAG: primase, primase protein [Candidatus Parcubacteria bacterium]|jgi:DNA primase